MNDIPIPRDIALPLPASPVALELLLLIAFLAHIVFVNLMVGGSILVLAFQIRGRKQPEFDTLARAIATTVTVNKSLAVVLGVAPLLLVNVLYTVHFYTANALTGTAWIMLIPAIAATFLLLYLHKFTWDRLRDHRSVHIAILGLAVVLLLLIPLVFIANVNLMTFPERWTSVRGFAGALAIPNVFPRYLHFVAASLVLTSLAGVWYVGRPAFPAEQLFHALDRAALRRAFYSVAFVGSLAQFIIGPLVLFTVPTQGLTAQVVSIVLIGAIVAVPATWGIWKELRDAQGAGRRLRFIAGYLAITVVAMGLGRHLYRGVALAEHRRAIQVATEEWGYDAAQAESDVRLGIMRAAAGVSEGEALFKANCGACHGLDRRVVGPPLVEIAQIYADDPDGIVTWARAPGKKRADMPQMPAMSSLGDAKLKAIAEHMLAAGKGAKPP